MSARGRRSPKSNVNALEFIAWLDTRRKYERDVDNYERQYINGVWVDHDTRRELRRYRNGHIATLRISTITRILNKFNLTYEDYQHGSSNP